MRVFTVLLVIVAASCTRPPRVVVYDAGAHASQTALDSVVLERTSCFGSCPAYRLSLARTGVVHFRSRNPGETLDTTDRIAPATLDALHARAIHAGFYSLPDSIKRGSPLCPDYATDHPSLTLTFFGDTTKRVFYNTGCFLSSDHTPMPAVAALGQLAIDIDSATGAHRWIHPGHRGR